MPSSSGSLALAPTASGRASLLLRQQQQRSVLDFVLDDARDFQQRLSNRDRLRMDEYLTSVREIERRIAATETANRQTPDPDVATPAGIPADYKEYMRLMYSMMLLAFQTDSTRICTFHARPRRRQPPLPATQHPRRAPLT